MKTTNPKFDHNLSKNSPVINVKKLPITRNYPEFWITPNPASHVQMAITKATKLKME